MFKKPDSQEEILNSYPPCLLICAKRKKLNVTV